MHWRWAVPVAILVVGYWLLAPLIAPALAPPGPPAAEAPAAGTVRPPTLIVRETAAPAAPAPVASATRVATTAVPTSTSTSTSAAAPPPTASPTPGIYRASPIENLKIEPRASEIVRLGRIEQGTQVRMAVSVRFNVSISNISGVPDVDVQVVGPTGTVANYPNARDGVRIAFDAPATGEYELRLDNTRSRVNAKRVTVQFG